jgi:hypothetical protein
MHVYSYCDISIESEIELPGLRLATDKDPDVFFWVDRSNPPLTIDGAWKQSFLGEANEISSAVLLGTDVHCLIFADIASFEIRNGFTEITCHPEPATSFNSVHHLLLDQVLPRVLAARGKLMLHGSCVEHPKGVIIFTGLTGAGKSTLAAHFSQHGFPLLSDDGVQLKQDAGKVTAIPTYPGLRLWEDSIAELSIGPASLEPMAHYSSKKRIPSGPVTQVQERPALCLFFIRPQLSSGSPSTHRIVKREAFLELNRQVFILDPFSREKSIARVRFTAEMVARLPMVALSIPHDYSMLNLVQTSVLEWVGTL